MTRHNEVLQRLHALIESDRCPPGRRLPPERELAVEMGVSRGALRRALAILEGKGLVWRHVGKGTFVGARPDSSDASLGFGSFLHNADSILEVRSILEPAFARIAAQRASNTDITRMRTQLQGAGEATNTETFEHYCDMLHRSFARATHNAILIRLYDALSPIRSLAHVVDHEVPLTPEIMDTYWQEHADIVEAVNAHDPAAAEQAMRRHIGHVRTDTPAETLRSERENDATGVGASPSLALEPVLLRPILVELSREFGEAANLAVLRDSEIEIVDVVMPPLEGQLSMHPGFGARPIESCASAKAILAFQSLDRRQFIIESTMCADGDPVALAQELEAVRRTGLAIADETLGTGTYGVAVPISLNDGSVRLSIGLIGAKARMRSRPDETYKESIKRSIGNTIHNLDEALGALKPYFR